MSYKESIETDLSLYEYMRRLCNLRFEERPNDYGHMLPTLIFEDTDEELEYCDFTGIDIPDTKVRLLRGEEMICDGLLIFGDGTVELHDKEDLDSYNWCEFEFDDLKTILGILKEMLATKQS